MKLEIKGRTAATITMNKIGLFLKGPVSGIALVDTDEKKAELRGLVSASLVNIVSIIEGSEDELLRIFGVSAKKNVSRVEVQNSVRAEQSRVNRSEAQTENMGSRVVVGSSGGAFDTKMVRNILDDVNEPPGTEASIEAMNQLERVAKSEIIDLNSPNEMVIDVNKKDDEEPSIAVIGGQAEDKTHVKMVNNLTNKDGATKDPFIDAKYGLSDDVEDGGRVKIKSGKRKPGRPAKTKHTAPAKLAKEVETIEFVDAPKEELVNDAFIDSIIDLNRSDDDLFIE